MSAGSCSLTSLAPEIVEAVLAGKDVPGLSLRQLRKGIPLLWSQQRESFGQLVSRQCLLANTQKERSRFGISNE